MCWPDVLQIVCATFGNWDYVIKGEAKSVHAWQIKINLFFA
jgi:hypothetical protein